MSCNVTQGLGLRQILYSDISYRVLGKSFWTQQRGSDKNWRKLDNEDLHKFYSSAYIIRVIKSRKMKWVGHIMHMRETRNTYRIGEPEGKKPLGRLGIIGKVISKWALKKEVVKMWTGFIWLRTGSSGRFL
jgi:hypothetical protein